MRVLVAICLAASAAGLVPHLGRPSLRRRHPTSLAATSADEAALIAACTDATRGQGQSASQRGTIDRLALALEEGFDGDDTNTSPTLPGRWRVLYQGVPGTGAKDAAFFSVDSWKDYLFGDGPSPIQNLVSGSSGVSRLYQIVQFDSGTEAGRVWNVIDASPVAVVGIEADLEGRPQPNRLNFRFTGGRVLLRALWGGSVALPYPIPFKLLGDEACGWLQTDYLSPQLRLSKGNKGTRFVFTPETEADNDDLMSLLGPPPPPAPAPPPAASLTRDPVLVCPAQFGTSDDYAELVDALRERGHPVVVAPLAFTDWLRLIPSSFTAAYWKGDLDPDTVLQFYYEALDKAVATIRSDHGTDRPIQLVGHSIGGWIARAYLGQLGDRSAISTLVTLGTPHAPPPAGFFSIIDQTRGLLRNVESRFPGAYHNDIRYLTVGSRKVRSKLFGGGLDGLVALASYLPLAGVADTQGDGIVPIECAHLDGAEQRECDAYHIAFVPGSGTKLIGTPWYGSRGVLEVWGGFLN